MEHLEAEDIQKADELVVVFLDLDPLVDLRDHQVEYHRVNVLDERVALCECCREVKCDVVLAVRARRFDDLLDEQLRYVRDSEQLLGSAQVGERLGRD